MEDVEQKVKKKNKIVFNRQSACLIDLRLLIEKQDHKTIVLWIFDCVQETCKQLQIDKTFEKRIREAIKKCECWARGEIKMPEAKKYILDVHAIAKEIEDPIAIALCHAIGQGISCVHTETHALGLVFYELSAIALANQDYEQKVLNKVHYYEERLRYWEKHHGDTKRVWAPFLLKEDGVNREWLLHQKEQGK